MKCPVKCCGKCPCEGKGAEVREKVREKTKAACGKARETSGVCLGKSKEFLKTLGYALDSEKNMIRAYANLKIEFSNDITEEPVSSRVKNFVRHVIAETLAYEGVKAPVSVSVTFMNDEQIKDLNHEFRDVDSATDVLSFPQCTLEEIYLLKGETLPIELGDIVVSCEHVVEQAEAFGHGVDRELAYLVCHSVLHLLGYDHELGEEEDYDMRHRQDIIMHRLALDV